MSTGQPIREIGLAPGVFGAKSQQSGGLFLREHGVEASDWPVQGHTREVLCQKFGSSLQGACLTAGQVEHLMLSDRAFHSSAESPGNIARIDHGPQILPW